jgi:hypothetical protein
MIAYGSYKRGSGKLHAHDKCEVCNEKKPPCKRRARAASKNDIAKEMVEK